MEDILSAIILVARRNPMDS